MSDLEDKSLEKVDAPKKVKKPRSQAQIESWEKCKKKLEENRLKRMGGRKLNKEQMKLRRRRLKAKKAIAETAEISGDEKEEEPKETETTVLDDKPVEKPQVLDDKPSESDDDRHVIIRRKPKSKPKRKPKRKPKIVYISSSESASESEIDEVEYQLPITDEYRPPSIRFV